MHSNETRWREGLQFDLDITLDSEKYNFDWAEWLQEIGLATLNNSATNVIFEEGLVVVSTVITSTNVIVLFECATGTNAPVVGSILKATCQAVTTDDQRKARSIYFRVVDKQ